MTITVSAPGSLMLLGEHAVLHGEPAIVCAIAQRIRVTLIPVSSKAISLRSALGEYQCFIDNIEIIAPFKFVLTAIQAMQDQLSSGFILEIQADFSAEIGFASSAAVTVATLAALYVWLNGKPADPFTLFQLAKSIIVKVQGRGSGADAAACVFGGTIAYRMSPCQITKLAHNPELIAIYSGNKTPTSEVIAIVNAARDKAPEKFNQLFTEIGECSKQAELAIQQGNWPALAKAMQANQQLMHEMGVNNFALQLIIDTLTTDHSILAAKISGSGLGDCVVGLIQSSDYRYPINHEHSKLGIKAIPITISSEGVIYE